MSGSAEVRYHPDVVASDMPRLMARLGSGRRLEELIRQMTRAVVEISLGRGTPSAPLRPPLQSWHRKKFHSRETPASGVNADARLIYRIDGETGILYILAIGLRLPGETDDVYAVTGSRGFVREE